MAESKRRPRKLKGAVLIMVVTLLFVLVVMLLATLTVVSNANRRTITKYEENQAYYTARSALEVYINEMLEDQDFNLGSATSQGNAIKGAWENDFVFDSPDSDSMATNLTSGKDFNGKDITNGFIHQQDIFCYLTPKYQVIYNSDETLTNIDPKSEANWEERTTSGYKPEDSYMEYTAVLPNTASSIAGESLGKLADGSDPTQPGKGEVNIKVELLRMVYLDQDGKVLYDGEVLTTNSDNLDGSKVKMSKIAWDQTYYRLKVTATTSISDSTGGSNESTISVLLEPNVKVSPASFTNAMTSFAGTSTSNKANIIGGSSADDPTQVYNMQNNPAILTGRFVYNYRGITVPNHAKWTYPSGGYFVNRQGWLYFVNQEASDAIVGSGAYNTTDAETRDNRPFIYATGLGSSNKMHIGTSDNAVDLVLVSNGGFATDSETSWLAGGTSSNVAFVSGSNGTEIYGDMYVDGDMVIKGNNVNIHGTVYCTGDIYLQTNSVTFENPVQLAGNVIKSDGSAYADEIPNLTAASGCPITAGSLKIAADNADAVEFTLPGRSSPVSVASTITETESYRDDDDGHILSAEEMLQDNVKNEDIELTVSSAAVNMTPATAVGGEFVPSTSNYNSQTGCYEYKLDLTAFQNNTGTYYIDTSSGNVHIQLTGNMDSAQPVFIVKGDNSAIFTIADGEYVRHKGMQVWSEQIYNMVTGGNTLELGDAAYFEKINKADPNLNKPDTPASPKIYYFIGNGATFEIYNGNNSFFCGYMYGPEANFVTYVGSNTVINYTYNGSAQLSAQVSILGSIVFKNIATDNNFGIAFQTPGGGGGDSNVRSMIQWDRQRYLGR